MHLGEEHHPADNFTSGITDGVARRLGVHGGAIPPVRRDRPAMSPLRPPAFLQRRLRAQIAKERTVLLAHSLFRPPAKEQTRPLAPVGNPSLLVGGHGGKTKGFERSRQRPVR